MTEIFQQILHWVEIHPLWSGITIFLVAMTESLAIVGLIIPGVAIMFGIGALIATGAIEFWYAFTWAVAGAITGDVSSFLLGFHFRERISGVWPFTRYRESLQQGQEFFAKHGSKSVAFGRFFGPVRAVVPLIAGTMGMRPWRFILASFLSSLVWAPAYLAPGMVFGASLELASQVAFRLVILIVLLAILVWLVLWIVRLTFRICQPHASSWLQAILNWSRLHPAFTDIAEALADSRHPEAKGLAIMATTLIFATGLTTLVLVAVLSGSTLSGIDHTLLNAFKSLHTPWANQMMLFCTHMADGTVIAVLIVVVTLFLAMQRHWRTLIYWLSAAGFTLLASTALKHGLQIPRPPDLPVDLGYSFPSGHTLKAVVLYGFLAVIIARSMRESRRWLPYSMAGLMITLVALSRLYLGVHWFSDILGSITLGIAWVAILGIAYYRHTRAETHWLGLGVISILIMIGATTAQTRIKHESDLGLYLPAPETSDLTAQQWRNAAWRQLPQMRKDVRNLRNHPLNIQYAGNLGQLESVLKDKGWSRAEPLTWRGMLKFLSPDSPLKELPLLPQVHDGRHEALALIKNLPDKRCLVLRLWPAYIRLQPGEQPLWLGNVTEAHKQTITDLLAFAETGDDLEEPFKMLLKDSEGLSQQVPATGSELLLLWAEP